MAAIVSGENRVAIAGEDGIIAARQYAREVAKSLGFGMVDQSRIATAVSELARNVVRYASGPGEMVIRKLDSSERGSVGLEIVISDKGPGIPDIEEAMREGFTTGSGMGLGLPGARRLVDELLIESAPGSGTIVTIRKWRR